MVRILPFRGLRYNTQSISDLGLVTAPPYDVIEPDEQLALYDKHAANIVRLILNHKTADDNADNNMYTRAKAFFEAWQKEGTLVPEAQPAVYAYSQTSEGIERKGLIALLQLEPYESGMVLPHENTLGGPKVDRMNLMKACRANFSQIFMIYRDAQRKAESLLFSQPKDDSWHHITDPAGVEHIFRPVTEPSTIIELQQLFTEQKLLIADGHHRYETALLFKEEVRRLIREKTGQEPPDGTLLSDYIMVFMTNMLDSGLKVYPTHRLLMNWPQGWDEARFEQALLQNFAQVESGEDFVYRTQSKTVKLKLTSHDAVAALPELLRPLDVAVLDQVVFQTIFGQTANALKDAKVLRFYRDEALVEHLISQKEAVAVFYMQAPNVEQVRDVCEAGFRMPQKSTYFYPKILSGLVLYSYGELSDGSHALDGSLQKRGQVLPADLFSLQRDLQPV